MIDTLIIIAKFRLHLAILLFIFSGCGCREHQEENFIFSSEELEIIPYKPNELFIFKNLLGDILLPIS